MLMSAEISLQTEYFNIMIKIPCLDIMRLFYTTLTGGVSQRTRRCFGEGCEGMNGFYQKIWPLSAVRLFPILPIFFSLGLPLEEKPCNTIRCGGPYGWMEWSEWGECSRTCGGGVRYRERNCEDICPMNRTGIVQLQNFLHFLFRLRPCQKPLLECQRFWFNKS